MLKTLQAQSPCSTHESCFGVAHRFAERHTHLKFVKIIFLKTARYRQSFICKSNVFVLPSYREGVPRSTQEAMAMGRAVITTDVPGCRETVIAGENGWLVPKWQPKRLAEQMELFINNPEAILEMGKKSFEIAKEKYDADIVNDRLVNMLWHQTEDHDYF